MFLGRTDFSVSHTRTTTHLRHTGSSISLGSSVSQSSSIGIVLSNGGIFGTLMIAVLGHAAFGPQITALVVVGLYTLVVTTVLVFVSKAVFPLRVSEEDEHQGLDLTSHGERAYDVAS